MSSTFINGKRKHTDSSVIGHITVYKYGKLFKPVSKYGISNERRGERSNSGSENFDRPGLISKIHHLLELHRAQRQKNIMKGSACSSNFHKALQKAIRMCYEQKICESKLYPVGDLFLELFRCAGNSSAIFSILFGSHMTISSQLMNTDVNILYPDHVVGDNARAFEYYLHHVSNLKDEIYEWNNGKMLDVVNNEIDLFSGMTPLSAAVQKHDPLLVLTLLRYGADPFINLKNDLTSEEDIIDPTEQLINDVNGLFLFKNTGFSEETRSKLAAEEVKVHLCLTYLRRSVDNIPLTSTSHVVTTSEEEESDHHARQQTTTKVYSLHPAIAQSMDMNYFKRTVSLKHLCRCSVRRCLKSNRAKIVSIPKAISQLPLPRPIKQYLDLQSD